MITLINGKKHDVIKRDGRIEPFNIKKLKRAVQWCCEGSEVFADEILNSLNVKIYDKIKIEKLWDIVISTMADKISLMFPDFDKFARNAYLLKIYKDYYGIKNIKENKIYPEFDKIIEKGISKNIYTKDILKYFSEEEIKELGDYIKHENDKLFNFMGVVLFMKKYAKNYTKKIKLELPQHTYMRVAMAAFMYDKSENRIEKIKKRYDDLSTFKYTEATPKMLNSLTPHQQLASCVLQRVSDNTESINYVDTACSLFSRHGGGLAIDVSELRCTGSSISIGGKSGGPIPFIQKFETTVTSFDQLGERKGACAIYFPFWHYDAPEMIMLKDAGGNNEARARKLQYAIKWYSLFSERIINDEEITLFDPKQTPKLLTTYGDEFKEWYLHYEKRHIKKRKIKARELAYQIAKVRIETGNLYLFFVDNVNDQNVCNVPVFSSNLCTEIVEPTKSASNFKDTIDLETGKVIKNYDVGEIALCNLTSINLLKWIELSEKDKKDLIKNLLEASDNMIDSQFYPVLDGEYSNKKRRPIGIGVSNFAAVLASKKVKFSDEAALKITHEIFEDLYYHIYDCSADLAKERGTYSTFDESLWALGKTPVHLFKNKSEKHNYGLKYDWDKLADKIKKYGVRFSFHAAIAPTATSGKIINATEGIEPTKTLFKFEEGTYTLPSIVPNLNKFRNYYDKAFDIDNKTLNDLACIRQKFIDQSQSVNHYYKKPDSAFQVISDIIDAEEKGMKTIYYAQIMKSDTEMKEQEICEFCV